MDRTACTEWGYPETAGQMSWPQHLAGLLPALGKKFVFCVFHWGFGVFAVCLHCVQGSASVFLDDGQTQEETDRPQPFLGKRAGFLAALGIFYVARSGFTGLFDGTMWQEVVRSGTTSGNLESWCVRRRQVACGKRGQVRALQSLWRKRSV